jgi:hypothetical protein
MHQIRKQSRPRARSVSVEASASEVVLDQSLVKRTETLLDLIKQLTG